MLQQLIWEYRYMLIVIAIFVLHCMLEWEKVKSKIYALMLQAKSLAKDAVLKSGDEQVEWVVKKSYQFLPKSIIIFISKDSMRKIIRYLYSKAKDYLDDEQLNNSI